MWKIFLPLMILTAIFISGTIVEKNFVSDDLPATKNFDDCEETLQRTNSVNWWETNMLTAEGYSRIDNKTGIKRIDKRRARQAAMMDGYRNLAKIAGKIQITSKKTLSKSKIDALIKGADVISETYDEDGNCSVVMTVPIYGVLDSFSKAAFKPVDKKDFPAPTENQIAEGNYTGLIIDCGDMEINPVLSPEIFSADKESIYCYGNLDYKKVISHGMIGYAANIFDSDEDVDDVDNVDDDNDVYEDEVILLKTDAPAKFVQIGSEFRLAQADENFSRAGDNPLVIKATELSAGDSCPVVSNEDADKILAENLLSHFLDEGAVVFTGNRIRGMRL